MLSEHEIADVRSALEAEKTPEGRSLVRAATLAKVRRLGDPDAAQQFDQLLGDGRNASDGWQLELRVLDVGQLLDLDLPPREYVLEPILREKETAMLHAWRGVGKTYVGLEIAFAVASGGTFLSWSAPRPRNVLYVDGEMPARAMQERLMAIAASRGDTPNFDPARLQLLCADLQEVPIPNLSTATGQAMLEPLAHKADLIILDSISTLASHGRENDSESWIPMQEWALGLRRQGKTILLLHHEGKGGLQRGTSRREDILDLVISLKRPADYGAQEGARFEVHFEKSRGISGEAVEPFEASLSTTDGRATWTTRKLQDAQLDRAASLFQSGCRAEEVAEELGVSRATAYRLRKKALEAGLVSANARLTSQAL